MRKFLDSLFDEDEQIVKIGRPRIWLSISKMQDDIKEYFEDCINHKATKYNDMGEPYEVSAPQIPTLEGLALTLGIDRKTLYNYSKEQGYEDFFPTIKRAKDYILAFKTDCLVNGRGSLPGLIFDLKNNHGFVDKMETDITTGGQPIQQVNHEIQIILND
jgi:hypothetical protein